MNINDDYIEIPSEDEGCINRGYCCCNYPGWFGPGEVEKAAELLKDGGIFIVALDKKQLEKRSLDNEIFNLFLRVWCQF